MHATVSILVINSFYLQFLLQPFHLLFSFNYQDLFSYSSLLNTDEHKKK